ncbi:hypothetical protein FHS01_002153 [Longimicrobium terrae]|uniref:Uncharacterized protein n=1 Tax=Longimicrobium terrae TaxID=1639882 RepID=A0A841GXP8_9BACT|nr:hypothetical protein [Longimicrobium terrae]MBB6070530.1 hypothetical protein [Longimicrobium terrae]
MHGGHGGKESPGRGSSGRAVCVAGGGVHGGPHPGSYYSPTLPQKRLGEGWDAAVSSV